MTINLIIAIKAAAEGAAIGTKLLDWIFDNFLLVVILLILLLVLYFVLRLMDGYTISQKNAYLESHGITPQEVPERPGFLSNLNQKLWDIVPIEKEGEIDLKHDYDGIHELDNRLPPWWLYGFYASIAFAAIYLYVYHGSDIGVNQKEEYEISMKDAEQAKLAYLASVGGGLDETNVELSVDAGELASGKEIYIANCAACHGPDGQGLVGPNFTDEYWIHGGGIKNVFKTIKYGVPEKGMISWQSQLRPETMRNVASYILSLQGTNPPNPKAPEGEVWKEEPADSE